MSSSLTHLPVFLTGLLLLGACNKGAAPASGSAVGAMAPEVSIPDETGRPISLSSFRGKQAVLFAFYPKDFTGG